MLHHTFVPTLFKKITLILTSLSALEIKTRFMSVLGAGLMLQIKQHTQISIKMRSFRIINNILCDFFFLKFLYVCLFFEHLFVTRKKFQVLNS